MGLLDAKGDISEATLAHSCSNAVGIAKGSPISDESQARQTKEQSLLVKRSLMLQGTTPAANANNHSVVET